MTYLAVGETPTHLNLMSTDSYLWMSHGDPFCNVVWEGWANTDFMGYPVFSSSLAPFFFFYLAFLTVQHFISGAWLALCILEQVSSVCLVFFKESSMLPWPYRICTPFNKVRCLLPWHNTECVISPSTQILLFPYRVAQSNSENNVFFLKRNTTASFILVSSPKMGMIVPAL